MKKSSKRIVAIFCIVVMALFATPIFADYPLLTTLNYQADPSCLEYNGTLYSYWSDDDDNNGSYSMHHIVCMSTIDLKHWTYNGSVFQVPNDASWAYNCWAPAVVYRNGYFWMYFGNGGGGIGVAKSASPTGPFKDAKGSALITPSMPNCNVTYCFDPGVLVDDNGRAYMFFGGGGPGNARVIEIGSDMISTVGTAVTINAPRFFEASWIHKYNGKYYYSYSSDFSQGAATIEYMMSSSPMSGYVAKGTVLPNPPNNNGNNNHHSIFQFRGNWYIAYHNRYLSNQQHIDTTYKRNGCLDQLFYNADGTMQLVTCTKNGLPLLPSPTPTPTPTVTPTITPTPTVTVTPTPIPTGCSIHYSQNDWGGGATVSITIDNNGSAAINGWTLAWSFAGNQQITNMWNGDYTQSGTAVTVKNLSYNNTIPAKGSVSLGFNLSYSGANAKPTAFTLNGTACQIQ